jgi:hypothetical protein
MQSVSGSPIKNTVKVCLCCILACFLAFFHACVFEPCVSWLVSAFHPLPQPVAHSALLALLVTLIQRSAAAADGLGSASGDRLPPGDALHL